MELFPWEPELAKVRWGAEQGPTPSTSGLKERLYVSAPRRLWTLYYAHARVSRATSWSLHQGPPLCLLVSKHIMMMAWCSEMASCSKHFSSSKNFFLLHRSCSSASCSLGLYAWLRSSPDNHLLEGAFNFEKNYVWQISCFPLSYVQWGAWGVKRPKPLRWRSKAPLKFQSDQF